MHDGRGHEEHRPKITGYLINDNARIILALTNPFRFLRHVNGQESEGQSRHEINGPGKRRKKQIKRNRANRSRRPRCKRRQTAPETRRNYFNEFFVQRTPQSGKLIPIAFSIICQWFCRDNIPLRCLRFSNFAPVESRSYFFRWRINSMKASMRLPACPSEKCRSSTMSASMMRVGRSRSFWTMRLMSYCPRE